MSSPVLHENSDQPRRIALVDCNNFYVSCERVFHPAWNNRPVGVLSNNDGCIVARSNELKAAGIPMGAPYFKHKKQLEAMKSVIVSSNYALYGDMSARVMHTLGQLAPDMEIYSIDEAWLDMTGIPPATLDALSRNIADENLSEYRYTSIYRYRAQPRHWLRLPIEFASNTLFQDGCLIWVMQNR